MEGRGYREEKEWMLNVWVKRWKRWRQWKESKRKRKDGERGGLGMDGRKGRSGRRKFGLRWTLCRWWNKLVKER